MTTAADLLVSDWMTKPVRTVRDSTLLAEVDRHLTEWNISCAPVLDSESNPVGVLSRFDLLRLGRLRARTEHRPVLIDLPQAPARKAMRQRVISVSEEASVLIASRTMLDQHIHRVFVRSVEGKLVGVVSTKDLFRAVSHLRLAQPVSNFESSPVLTVDADTPIDEATDRLSQSRIQGLVVLEEGRPIGLFTELEALEGQSLPKETPVERCLTYSMLCLPPETPLFRAAGMAAATRVRRVLTVEHRTLRGILTGLDFARALG